MPHCEVLSQFNAQSCSLYMVVPFSFHLLLEVFHLVLCGLIQEICENVSSSNVQYIDVYVSPMSLNRYWILVPHQYTFISLSLSLSRDA